MPGHYADTFRVLRDEGLVNDQEADDLMAVDRFRDLLVHQHAEVDEERMPRIFRTGLDDPDDFVGVLRRRFAAERREDPKG